LFLMMKLLCYVKFMKTLDLFILFKGR
jgi:hypothetical protein